MHLDKEQSGVRWCEIRKLWLAWDPIGVCPLAGGPEDEYDNYLGPTLRLLERGATTEEITNYLSYIVGDHMGLEQSGIEHSKPHEFSKELQQWFASKWAGSYV